MYDKIREVRRGDEDAPLWDREIKEADWKQVIQLATRALETETKDLTLAAWLAEALLKTDGYGGLRDGLLVIKALTETFWDTLYPEIEDGDLEMRAGSLEWIGAKLDLPLKHVALTSSRLDWNAYQESRRVGYKSEVAQNESRRASRDLAIQEGKCLPEDFDAEFNATPKSFYVQAADDITGCVDTLMQLDALCEEKFGETAPSFRPLRYALNEVQETVRILLNKKRQFEPDGSVAAEEALPGQPDYAAEAAPLPTSEEPESPVEAISRIVAAAAYLRGEDPFSPAPYLLLRALRWGELRAGGRRLDTALLVPPVTWTRLQLKELAAECNWLRLLKACESEMAAPHGRAWLDLQRYAIQACEHLGAAHAPIAHALRSELAHLLAEYPELPDATLADDTPTANSETRAWIREAFGRESLPALGEPLAGAQSLSADGQGDTPYALALRKMEAGQPKEAVELLSAEIARQPCGRDRFRIRLQLADICLRAGYTAMAKAILEELVQAMDQHRLEDWESPESLARVLAMLYRCLETAELDPARKADLYSRICRLAPHHAEIR